MWLLLDILYVLQSNFFLVRWNIVEKSSKDSFGYFVSCCKLYQCIKFGNSRHPLNSRCSKRSCSFTQQNLYSLAGVDQFISVDELLLIKIVISSAFFTTWQTHFSIKILLFLPFWHHPDFPTPSLCYCSSQLQPLPAFSILFWSISSLWYSGWSYNH